MEKIAYRPFSVSQEKREGLNLKQREYEERLRKYRQYIISVILIKIAVSKTHEKNILPNRAYILDFYKSKIIEWILKNGLITYPFALSEIKKLKIYYNEMWFKQAYITVQDYCHGTLRLPQKDGSASDKKL